MVKKKWSSLQDELFMEFETTFHLVCDNVWHLCRHNFKNIFLKVHFELKLIEPCTSKPIPRLHLERVRMSLFYS